MGPEGLEQAGRRSERPLPAKSFHQTQFCKSIPVADVNSITYRKLECYNYTTVKQPEGFDVKDLPFRFHLDDINSQFVRFYVFLDMNQIRQEDRPFVVLLTELWLQCPVKSANGTISSLEEVIGRRSRTALTFYNDLGYKGSTYTPGSQSHMIMFYAEAKLEKYMEVVDMVKEALFHVEFSIDRANSIISQLLNGIPSLKNSASSVVNAIFDNIYFDQQSFVHHASFLRQKSFLAGLKRQMASQPGKVIGKLHSLRKLIVTPKSSFIYMATNVKQLTEMYGSQASDVWKSFFEDNELEPAPPAMRSTRYPIKSEYNHRDMNPAYKHAIVSLPGTESCYLYQAIHYDNTDWESEEVAAARVMLQYLTDRMYDQIRGQGWTYGVGISVSVTEGRLKVYFSRSSSLGNAYAAFRNMISNYTRVDQPLEWDPVLLDSARGSLIYNWVEVEETPESLSLQFSVGLFETS